MQRTFWDDTLVPPFKMFNISQMKTSYLKRTIENKGEHMNKAEHMGIRNKYKTGS